MQVNSEGYILAGNWRPIVAAFLEDERVIDDHFDLRVGLFTIRESEDAVGVVVETLLDVSEHEAPHSADRECQWQMKRLFHTIPWRSILILPLLHTDVEQRPVDHESTDNLVLPEVRLVVHS